LGERGGFRFWDYGYGCYTDHLLYFIDTNSTELSATYGLVCSQQDDLQGRAEIDVI